MCDPISIGIGLAVATTATSIVGQVQAANATNKAIAKQQKVQAKQINDQATQEVNDRLRQARRDEARILVAAGESGLSLESGAVKALALDAEAQATLDNQTSLANRESRQAASVADANAKLVSKPTALGAGLQIGLAGVQSAANNGAFKNIGKGS